MKQLKKGMMDSADFLREAKIMKTLRHQNLIQLYAVGIWFSMPSKLALIRAFPFNIGTKTKVTLSEPILIVTELMVNGALNKYLQSPAGQMISQKVAVPRL